jgi:predicted DNA-binding transcriptional regulator AlpA
MNTSEDQLLLAEEVAEMLRIPKAQVYRLAKSNRITKVSISERCTRYSENSVLRFINSVSQ